MPLRSFSDCIKRVKHLYLWVALSFIIFIAWRHSSDLSEAADSLLKMPAGILIQCLTLTVLSYSFRSLRWLGYMQLREEKSSTTLHFIIYLSGFAFTASPGKSGELMRGTHLHGIGVPFSYTLFSFLSERLFDVIVVLFLGTYFLIERFSIAFVILSICLLVLPTLIAPTLSLILNFAKEHVSLELIKVLKPLWGVKITLKNQVFTLFSWLSQGLILFLILQSYGSGVSIVMAISIYCLSLLIGAASLIPGGIGVTEVGMIWLLTQIGVDSNDAIIASLITRMLTLWPAMLVGLFCAFILKKTEGDEIS